MLARVDQELHFCENIMSEYLKLPCCTNQSGVHSRYNFREIHVQIHG